MLTQNCVASNLCAGERRGKYKVALVLVKHHAMKTYGIVKV
jgi:hypothetical protein